MSEKFERREIEKVAHTHKGTETADSENSVRQEPNGDTFDDLDLNNTLATQPDDYVGEARWSLRKFLAAVSLAGLFVGGSIPTLLIGASMQYIGADLQVTYSSWLITANTLAIAVTSPYVGYLTDLIGPRYIILFGGFLLMIGMAVVGSAQHFGAAVAGMTVAGIGCGICEVNSISGIAELAPVRLRGLYLGLVTFCMIFFNPYTFYTQLLCREATWRWVAWLILIWVAISWSLCVFFYFPDSRRHRIKGLSKMQIVRRMDWIGGATSVVGLTLILVALQDGGYRHPWASAAVLAPLLIGIFVFAGFVVWEGWYAPHPMIPHVLLRERGVLIPLSVAFGAGITYYALLGFKPLLFQRLYYTEPPLQIGALNYGFSAGLLFGSAGVNTLLSYTKGNVRAPILFCCLMMTAFTGALMQSTPENPTYTAIIAAFCAFGIGGVLVPSATVALTCCPDSLVGTVSGLAMSVRTLGGAIGTTVYSAIYQNKLGDILPRETGKYAIEAGLPTSSLQEFLGEFLKPGKGNASSLPGVTPEVMSRAALGQAWGYSRSFRYVWIASVAFGVVACVMSLFIPNTAKYMTNRIAVDVSSNKRRTTADDETKGL